jgi:hypothetical protein
MWCFAHALYIFFPFVLSWVLYLFLFWSSDFTRSLTPCFECFVGDFFYSDLVLGPFLPCFPPLYFCFTIWLLVSYICLFFFLGGERLLLGCGNVCFHRSCCFLSSPNCFVNFVSSYNGAFAGFFLYICSIREELEMDLGYVLDVGLMLDAWALCILSVNTHAELRFVLWFGCCHCC